MFIDIYDLETVELFEQQKDLVVKLNKLLKDGDK